MRRTPPLALWLLAGAFALVVRLPGLDRSLWYDELFTLLEFAGSPLQAVTRQVAANNHPLASLLVWPFLWLAPHSEVVLRLPFLCLGVAAVLALGWSGARVGGDRPARAVMSLAVLSPLAVLLSQQVRGYAGLLLAAALLPGLLLNSMKAPTRRVTVLLAAAVAAGLYSHLTLFVGVLGALGGVALTKSLGRRATLQGLAAGVGVGLLLYAPMWSRLWKYARQVFREGDPGAPDRLGVTQLLALWGGEPGGIGLLLGVLVGGLAVWGGCCVWRESLARCAILSPLLGLPLFLVYPTPGYARFLSLALPCTLLLAALGVCRLPRLARPFFLAGALFSSAWQVGGQSQQELQNLRGALELAREQVPEARLFSDGPGAQVLVFYDRSLQSQPQEGGAGVLSDISEWVYVSAFPAWMSPARRRDLRDAGQVFVLPGRISPVLVYVKGHGAGH